MLINRCAKIEESGTKQKQKSTSTYFVFSPQICNFPFAVPERMEAGSPVLYWLFPASSIAEETEGTLHEMTLLS